MAETPARRPALGKHQVSGSGCRSEWLRVSKAPVSPHVFVPANRDGKAKLEGGSGKSGSPGDRCCGAQPRIRQLLWDPGQAGPAGGLDCPGWLRLLFPRRITQPHSGGVGSELGGVALPATLWGCQEPHAPLLWFLRAAKAPAFPFFCFKRESV